MTASAVVRRMMRIKLHALCTSEGYRIESMNTDGERAQIDGVWDKRYRRRCGGCGHITRMVMIGFVVGFGVPHLVNSFGRDDVVLVEVLYEEPKICLYANEDDPNLVGRIVGTKSREWKYEEEYRLIIPRGNFKDVEGEKEGDPLFWSTEGNEQVVRSVIIGSRCDPKWKTELAAVLDEPAYQHAETFVAIPDKTTFSIHIEPIKLH